QSWQRNDLTNCPEIVDHYNMQASRCPRRIGMEGHLLTLSFERHVTSMIWADSLDFSRYCLTARLQMMVSGVSGKIMLDVVDT
ncbi:MAG: hypothetical protein V7681_18140, partial [Halopseudomonas sabulinigri]